MAEDLSDAALKADRSLAEMWAMPVVHLRATYFKSPRADTVNPDERQMLIDRNAKAAVPHMPWWFLPEN